MHNFQLKYAETLYSKIILIKSVLINNYEEHGQR